MKVKLNRVFIGLGLLVAAAFLVVDQLHLLPIKIGIWTIFLTIIFGSCLITSLIDRSLYGVIFSLTFLLIVFAKPLHIQALSPWTILLVAVLISVGISLIFKRSFKPTVVINGRKIDASWSDLKNPEKFKAGHVMSQSNFGVEGENIVISEKMSDASRYIHSQDLKTITINSKLADIDVYLDDAKAAGEEVIVNINSSMSDINFYLPSDWRIENRLQQSFGDLEIDYQDASGSTLVLQGASNICDITIKHINK